MDATAFALAGRARRASLRLDARRLSQSTAKCPSCRGRLCAPAHAGCARAHVSVSQRRVCARRKRGGAATVELAAASVDAGESQEFRRRVRTPAARVGAARRRSATSKPAPLQEWAGSRVEPVLVWLVLVWLAGMLVQAFRLFGGWRAAERLKRQGNRPLGRSGKSHSPASAASSASRAPCACASRCSSKCPRSSAGSSRSSSCRRARSPASRTQQLEALIAHELAHVRRHDYLVNLLQTSWRDASVLPPGGVVGLAPGEAEREHACDDLAVSATRGGRCSLRARAGRPRTTARASLCVEPCACV